MDAPDSFFADYDPEVIAQLRPRRDRAEAWVREQMEALSLPQKIAQLFMVKAGVEKRRAPVSKSSVEAAKEHGVGGFLVSRTLESEAVRAQTEYLQERADLPLLCAADYERGAGTFKNDLTELPSNMAVGATRNEKFAAASARLAAFESRALGINVIFAPVVDVNSNPDNPIINMRSYGERPSLVGRMGAAYVHGASGLGIITTLKHFPGHGDSDTDTHTQMAVLKRSREELEAVEFEPYRIALRQETQPDAVMSAHLWVQAFDEKPWPATFSHKVITGLLRDEMGFDGLVFTDAVKMGALKNDYSLAERVLQPLLAGVDVVVAPENLEAALEAVVKAVRDERLSIERLESSVYRVLRAKAAIGLHHERVPPQAVLKHLREQTGGQDLADTIADASITLIGSPTALPLDENCNVTLVQLSNYKESSSVDAAMNALAERLTLGTQSEMDVRPGKAINAANEEKVFQAVSDNEDGVVVLALHLRLSTSRGSVGLFEKQHRFVARLLRQSAVPVILVALGNPYIVKTYPEAEAYVVAYDQTVASVNAVSDVLLGIKSGEGRLPITVGEYPFRE